MNKYSRIAFILLGFSLSSHISAQDINQDQQPAGLADQASEQTVETHYIRLRALDKITARITEVEAPLGEDVRFGTLSIRGRYCRSTPPEEKPESYAFLRIDDIKVNGDREKVYEGWMIASSPAITALEHAVYDVWVIGCKTVSPSASTASE